MTLPSSVVVIFGQFFYLLARRFDDFWDVPKRRLKARLPSTLFLASGAQT
jgi:hypothetical protein